MKVNRKGRRTYGAHSAHGAHRAFAATSQRKCACPGAPLGTPCGCNGHGQKKHYGAMSQEDIQGSMILGLGIMSFLGYLLYSGSKAMLKV